MIIWENTTVLGPSHKIILNTNGTDGAEIVVDDSLRITGTKIGGVDSHGGSNYLQFWPSFELATSLGKFEINSDHIKWTYGHIEFYSNADGGINIEDTSVNRAYHGCITPKYPDTASDPSGFHFKVTQDNTWKTFLTITSDQKCIFGGNADHYIQWWDYGFYVNGDGTFRDISASTLFVTNINATNQIKAATFYATSDRRLKTDIVDYVPQASILDLPIKQFKFKDSDTVHIGCVAQDLQQIAPELVHEDDNGYLSIEENKLVYLLLDEVKRLKAEINALRG